MAVDRQIPNSTTVGAITGDDFMDAAQEELTKLYDVAIISLGTIAGTADAITAVADPPLTGALVGGMKFAITPTATNTIAAITLKIGASGAVVPIVDRDGNALAIGQWVLGRRHVLEYDATLAKHRVLGNIEPTPTAATPLPSFRNILVNGGMEIWQRGAGDSASIAVGASNTAYTTDRWYLTTGASQAHTVSAQNGLSSRSRKSGRVQRNSGQTGTGVLVFAYPLTTEECVRLRGAKISLQFLAMAGLNFSPTSGTLNYNVYFGTGSEGRRGAGFTGETNPLSGSVNLTADGTTVSTVTATSAGNVATNVTQGEIRFSWTPVGTAGANDWVQLDDVQLESGAAATAFEYATFGFMLLECQRHYAKTFPYNTAPTFASTTGIIGGLTSSWNGETNGGTGRIVPSVEWRFPVPMRTSPTVSRFSPGNGTTNWWDSNSGSSSEDIASVINGDERRLLIKSASTVVIPTLSDTYTIHAVADAAL